MYIRIYIYIYLYVYMYIYIIKTIIYTYNNYIYAYIYILTIKGLHYTFFAFTNFLFAHKHKYYVFYYSYIHFDQLVRPAT